jgi:NhaA family Na+:H+ antiporter
MLGSRTPSGLIVFLTAFAIVDDIGAILVIVLFYAYEVHWQPLMIAGGLFLFLILCNRWFRLSRNWLYILVGVFIWYYLFKSGIHPTIAGVLVALTIPVKHLVPKKNFLETFKEFLKKVRNKDSGVELTRRFYQKRELDELYRLKHNIKGVMPPLQRLEFRLEEFVSHFVVPVFALANAGISLSATGDSIFQGLTLSIMGAMVLGKLLGIFSFTWLSIKLGLTDLPSGTRWIHIVGVGLLGGVGFTMAIFISNLSIIDPTLLQQAKLGILLASFIAGLSGYLLLRYTLPQPPGKT